VFSNSKAEGTLKIQGGDPGETGQPAAPGSIVCCGVRIDPYGFDHAVTRVLAAAQEREPVAVHLCNAYTLSLARGDPALGALLNRGDLNFPDGMPLIWIARHLGLDLRTRVYGPDLMEAVLDRGRHIGLRHFFYGSTPAVLERLVDQICARFPGLIVAGVNAPPFRPLTALEEADVIDQLKGSEAQIVWVGLGTPKQDEFVDRFRDLLGMPLVAVGAAFDFHAGTVPQAPHFIQQFGLEWAYRLLREPRRLWRRYLFGNIEFLRGLLDTGTLLEAPARQPSADIDSPNLPKVAVLMTSHNRRDRTLACLASLFAQAQPAWQLRVVLIDAGSTDGTAEAVRVQFPMVEVRAAGGDLYWAGGMRLADEAASLSSPDFFLWLNDDVVLDQDAIRELLQTYRDVSNPTIDDTSQSSVWRGLGAARVIVVGATRDPTTAELTYSGVRRSFHRTRFHLVPPGERPRKVDTMNGNIVLVSAGARSELGNLDPAFQHGMADYDYGLRAKALGIPVWVAPGTIGTCPRNAGANPWRRGSLKLSQRLRALRSPKGIPPRDWAAFTRRHAGPLWPLYWASPYLRAAFRRRA
jgi:exopolysaccharide biosynthesis WecB/TagA/CpsF family protein